MGKAFNNPHNDKEIKKQFFQTVSIFHVKLLITAILLFLITYSLTAKTAIITNIYYQDYDIINRTVITAVGDIEYRVTQDPGRRKIIVEIDNAVKDASIPPVRQTPASAVIERITTEMPAYNRLKITITTKQPFYLEHFSLNHDHKRLVLDIFNKKYPETEEEKLIFAEFFTMVGFPQRAEDLISKLSDIDHVDKMVDLDQDLITLSRNISFTDAVKIFNSYIQDKENKLLLNLTDIDQPIGFNIEKIHWESAMHSLFHKMDIEVEEKDNIYILRRKVEDRPAEEIEKELVFLDNVLIEATFFEADFNTIRELGIDWGSVVDGRVRLSADVRSSQLITQELLTVRSDTYSYTHGSNTIDINTLFRAFAASDKGNIISRPQITVLSGETGTVQDGTDYTILVPGRTGTGEEVTQAHEVSVESGTIVDVTPVVKTDKEGEKVIHLTIKVERSSAQPDVTGFSKTTAEVTSQKILYNGEETVIGGLIAKESVSVRTGIPFLKDLPWWFFGIRYLAGHNRYEMNNKELIILIKATILPSVEERRKIGQDVAREIEFRRQQMRDIEPKFLE